MSNIWSSWGSEVRFIDGQWNALVAALSTTDEQLRNSMGCLILLTDADVMLASLNLCDDSPTNSRMLLTRLRKYLRSCPSRRERQRCVNVMLASVQDLQVKGALCDEWESSVSPCVTCEDEEIAVQVI